MLGFCTKRQLGTAVMSSLHSGVVVLSKAYLLSSPNSSWLCWYGPVGTTVQIMPGLHHIMDTRQVRKYPDIQGIDRIKIADDHDIK